MLSSNQVSAAAMTYASDEKWRPFNCFFVRVGLKTYQHPCKANLLFVPRSIQNTQIPYDHNVEFLKVKPFVTYSYRYALKG